METTLRTLAMSEHSSLEGLLELPVCLVIHQSMWSRHVCRYNHYTCTRVDGKYTVYITGLISYWSSSDVVTFHCV